MFPATYEQLHQNSILSLSLFGGGGGVVLQSILSHYSHYLVSVFHYSSPAQLVSIRDLVKNSGRSWYVIENMEFGELLFVCDHCKL